jgi:glycerol transport system ATP-binding protein
LGVLASTKELKVGLRLEHIEKIYGTTIKLRDINLELESGMFLALIAPTGTGKTTLLRVMAGLEKPDFGRIIVDGEDVTNVHVRKRNVAMVYQQFINYPPMTVFDNIASPLRVAGKSANEIDKRVRDVADKVQISEYLDRLPQALSGGQQQRVAIARALAKDAKLILLDEPLGNLDYKLREDLRLELKNIASESDAMFVYATPEPIDALTMASHAAILHNGEIIQMGDVRDVYLRPNRVISGQYFSDPPMNFLPARVESGVLAMSEQLKIPVDTLQAPLSSGEYIVGIRPHHIEVRHKGEGSNVDDRFLRGSAEVELAEIVGSDTTIHLKHHGNDITALSNDVGFFDLGEEVSMFIDSQQMHIFSPTGSLLVSAKAVRG